MQVGDVVIRMAADLADLRTGMEQGKEAVTNALDKISGVAGMAKTALAALGVAASAGMFVDAIRGVIDYADNLNDLSQRTGITVETLGGLDYIAKQSGTNLESLANGSQKLAQLMANAAGGNVEAAKTLETFGVQARNADGSLVGLDEALFSIADRFATYKDGPEKAAAAQELMSKGGKELIPLLNQGGEALRAAIGEYQKYGGVTTETARQADAFNDTLAKIELISGTFTRQLTAALLPTMNSLAGIFVDVKGKGNDFSGVIDILVSGVKILGIGVVGVVATFDVLGRGLGSVAAAAVAVSRGEFSQAWTILKEGGSDAASTIGTAMDRAKTIWNASATSIAGTSNQITPPIVNNAKAVESALYKEWEALEKLRDKWLEVLDATEGGFGTQTLKDLDELDRLLAAGQIGWEQYDKALAIVLDKDPVLRKEQEEINKLLKETEEIVGKVAGEWNKEIAALDDQITKQQNANATFGLGKAALMDLTIAQLEHKIAIEQSGDAYSPYAAHLEEVRAKMIALRDATAMGEALDQQKKVLDEAAKGWDKFIGDVSAKADDFITDVVEKGWGTAFQNLWGDFKKWAINAFAEIAAKQVVVSLVGSLGLTGGAAGNPLGGVGSGGGGGILDSLMNVGSGLAGTFSQLGGAASTFMSVLGTGAPIGQAFSQALATGTLSLGSLVPVVGGVIAAGTMIYNWLDSKRGGPKDGGFATTGPTPGIIGVDGDGRWMTPSNADAQMVQAVNGLNATFENLLEALGGSGAAVFAQGFSTDPKGTAPSNVHTGVWVNGTQVFDSPNGNVGRDDASLQAELSSQASRAILAALQASSLPDVVAGYLASIDVATATVDQITAALARAADLAELVKQVSALPEELANGLLNALGVSDELDAQIREFASSFSAFSEAAGKLQDALDRDPKAEALEAVAAAHASTFEKVGLARDALGALLGTYDGSKEATDALAGATNAYRDAQVAALVQIEQVRTALGTMFGDTIRNMDLALLSTAQQKQFYIDEALATKKLLEQTTDPAEIEKLSRIINDDVTAAFRLMDPTEQKAQHDYLKGILDDAKNITDKQLTASADLITDAGEGSGSIINLAEQALTDAGDKWRQAAEEMAITAATLREAADAIKAAASDQAATSGNIGTAAGAMNNAANTMQVAANTPLRVEIDVNQSSGP